MTTNTRPETQLFIGANAGRHTARVHDVIVVGAGMAGLAAARQVQAAGHTVTVLDKSRGVGGRLATRRIGDAVLDHGAQFFTVRGDSFSGLVDEAAKAGAVAEWCRGFGEEDGYARWRGDAGMTSLAKWMAQPLDVQLANHVHAISVGSDGVRVVDATGTTLALGNHAIVTAPIPQILTMFGHGDVAPGSSLEQSLRATSYFATLALLAVVNGPTNVAEPGGMQFETGPFTFIADNQRKGISPVQALTFHAAHEYSLRRYDDDDETVHGELLAMAAPWLGEATVVESQLKKWRYAGPVKPLTNRTEVIAAGAHTIALAGDAFGGPKIEGAFNSGQAAADAVAAAIAD